MTHTHPAWGVQPTLGFSGRVCPTAAQALSSDALHPLPQALPSTRLLSEHQLLAQPWVS